MKDIVLDEIVGPVLMKNRSELKEREQLIDEVLEIIASRGVGFEPDEWEQVYMLTDARIEAFYGNSSPCWKCGSGEGQIIFDELEGGYFHERCL